MAEIFDDPVIAKVLVLIDGRTDTALDDILAVIAMEHEIEKLGHLVVTLEGFLRLHREDYIQPKNKATERDVPGIIKEILDILHHQAEIYQGIVELHIEGKLDVKYKMRSKSDMADPMCAQNFHYGAAKKKRAKVSGFIRADKPLKELEDWR